VRLDLVFNGEKCISFDGGSMRNVRPDEQSLVGILRAGLRRLRDRGEGRIMQGINTYVSTLEALLEGAKGMKLYFGGGGGKCVGFSDDFCVLFQFPCLEGQTEGKLMRMGFQSINLGRCQLSPDQAVVVLNNRADRAHAYG
jgi:tRNA pseudouridine-54 N-methylase